MRRLGALGGLALWLLAASPAAPSLDDDAAAADLLARRSARVQVPDGMLPAAILQFPDRVSHGVVVDADDNRLLVLERRGEHLEIVRDLYVAIGKAGADKRIEGDEKTPIGVYYVTRAIDGVELPAIYGAGALPVNYPNAWDRRHGRTGSGIWLHGTDKTDTTLMPRSSRGCLTVLDEDFELIRSSAAIGAMPIVIGHGIEWLPRQEIVRQRRSVREAIDTWRADWESREPEAYLRHYAEDFRSDGMSRERWAQHKRRVNAAKRFIDVDLEELGLYSYPGEDALVVATYRQVYRSDDYARTRLKHQYWQRRDGLWKIVWEGRP